MRRLLHLLGIDRAIAYTLAGRGWSLLSGLVTLLLVAKYLSADEQGYYFTFASVLAMQVLLELGMSFVVTQFASHEMAELNWSAAGVLEGDARAMERMRSLIVLLAKWYGVIGALLVAIILPAGWVFFLVNEPESVVAWRGVWIWLVLATAANVFLMPFLSLLEGCGRITEVARMRLYQSVGGSLAAWAVLADGGGLLAMPVMSTVLALVALLWLWRTKTDFIRKLLAPENIGATICWRREIWPFQWRIAVSWLSGYFIFQLFTPILFAYRGAAEAGQMGMSISIANALMGIAIAWMNAKAPGFGSLVAVRDYKTLDRVFALTMSRSLAVLVAVGIGLCIVNYVIHVRRMAFADRLLDPLPFVLLIVATVFAYITYAQSMYLRAHKEDPFMLISLVSAVLIGCFSMVFGQQYGALGLMAVYVSVYGIIGVGWGNLVFMTARRRWQKAALTHLMEPK